MENNVKVIHIGQDIVRVHGTPNMERIKAATEKFMRQVERERYEKRQKTTDRTAKTSA